MCDTDLIESKIKALNPADTRLYKALVQAAQRGERCPTNEKILDDVAFAYASTVSLRIRHLESLGIIQVERNYKKRVIKFPHLGIQTKTPEDMYTTLGRTQTPVGHNPYISGPAIQRDGWTISPTEIYHGDELITNNIRQCSVVYLIASTDTFLNSREISDKLDGNITVPAVLATVSEFKSKVYRSSSKIYPITAIRITGLKWELNPVVRKEGI